MAYTFDQIFAADPDNPEMVASGGMVLLFAPGDESKTPLVITDATGVPLPNPVPVNEKGFGPAFMSELDRVAWEAGGLTGFFTSYEGMRDVAVQAAADASSARLDATASAQAATTAAATAVAEVQVTLSGAVSAAEQAAIDAANAAGLVGAPADTAIAAALDAEDSQSRGVLDTTIAGAVAPKLDSAEKGAPEGVAMLDADSLVPLAQIPDILKAGNGGKPIGKGELVLNVKDYGAKGDGVTNDTAAINIAISAAIAAKKKLYFPTATYIFDGFRSALQGMVVSMEGEEGEWPTLKATQSAVNTSNYMLLLSSTRYSTVAGLTLAAEIKPGQQKIALNSVAGLSRGMVIQISSNRLWYNGHRDAYYCGEIHKITDVDTVNKTVSFADMTRDVYSFTDTLTIRAWVPNKVSIKNFRFEAPYPSTLVTSVGICLQQCVDARLENLSFKGFRSSNILDVLSVNTRIRNVGFENDDKLDTSIGSGYGIETNGSLGLFVDGLDSKGLRRAFDAGSLGGTTEAAVARSWHVTNFDVDGGGAWFPNSAAIGYGVGMHGSSEGGTFSSGRIKDCSNGVTVRGRNTTVRDVTFIGKFDSLVSLHENGAGLIVEGCKYENPSYHNMFADLGTAPVEPGAAVFVQLGLVNGGVPANCFYDLPIIIRNNVAKGLTRAFIQISQNTLVAKNLRVDDNSIEAMPGAGNTFTTYHAYTASTNLTDSVFNNNTVTEINGSAVTWSPLLVPAYRESTTLRFKVDGTHYARIPTDTVVRIPRVVRAGQRAIVLVHADTGGFGFFRLVPESAGLTSLGSAPSGTMKATATGSALTGTTGLVGDMTFGLMNNGDLWIENRAAGAYTFRLTIQ